MLNLLSLADPLEHVEAHRLVHWLPFTNHMLMVLVAAILMLLIFPRLFNKAEIEAPTGAKNFFEAILEFLRLEVFRPALKEHTDRFVPFLWTLFFFILFCNLLGALPLSEFFELISFGYIKHVGGAATGNINTTAALAICAFFFIHGQGLDQIARGLMDGTYGHHAGHHDEHSSNGVPPHEAAHDLEHVRGEALPADANQDLDAIKNPTAHYRDDEYSLHPNFDPVHAEAGKQHVSPLMALLMAVPIYLWNFAPHPFRPKKGESQIMWLADIPMFAMLLLLELFGALVKPFALAMRLFANMVAGHVLLAVLIALIASVKLGLLHFVVGVPIAVLDLGIQLLEIFVAFLQAYIFTFLTTLFLASAVAPEH